MKPSYRIKGSVFATFFVCCIITVLLCSALATDHWVTASAKRNISNPTSGSIHFGLFNGKKVLNSGLGDRTTTIKFVCQTNASVCMFSCGSTADDRTDDLADMVYNNGAGWDQDKLCKSHAVSALEAESRPLRAVGGTLGLLLTSSRALLRDSAEVQRLTEVPQTEPQFMSYGLWLSTIVMMGAAIAFVLVAAMFAILNTATNPVETITGVVGLYVWNGIAMVFELLALSLWGAQFHQRLQHSMLWREELVQQWTTDGLANLGYSYWLVFVAMILHAVNMAILWYGTHQKQPKKVQIPVERGNTNAVNMIY